MVKFIRQDTVIHKCNKVLIVVVVRDLVKVEELSLTWAICVRG